VLLANFVLNSIPPLCHVLPVSRWWRARLSDPAYVALLAPSFRNYRLMPQISVITAIHHTVYCTSPRTYSSGKGSSPHPSPRAITIFWWQENRTTQHFTIQEASYFIRKNTMRFFSAVLWLSSISVSSVTVTVGWNWNPI